MKKLTQPFLFKCFIRASDLHSCEGPVYDKNDMSTIKIRIKYVSWVYSCDEEYLEVFHKEYYKLYSHETDLIN